MIHHGKSKLRLGLHVPSVRSGGVGDDLSKSVAGEEENSSGSGALSACPTDIEIEEVGVPDGDGPGDPAPPLAGSLLIEIENAALEFEDRIGAIVDQGASIEDFEREFFKRLLRDKGRFPLLGSLVGQGSLCTPAVSGRPLPALAGTVGGVSDRLRSTVDSRDLRSERLRGQKHLRGLYGNTEQGRMDSYNEFVQRLNEDGVLRGRKRPVPGGYSSGDD